MQHFSPLTAFYEAIAGDPRINATHISVYMALLQHWNLNQRENPIVISRDNIMKMAKINIDTLIINALMDFMSMVILNILLLLMPPPS